MDIMSILSDWGPREMANGEIRMRCCFRDKHDSVSDGNNSFFINPNKNVYRCWSCKSTGTALSLLTGSIFKVPYSEAINLVNWEESLKTSIEGPSRKVLSATTSDVFIDFSKPPKQFTERKISARVLRHFRVGSYIDDNEEEVAVIPYYDEETGDLRGVKNRKKRSFWFPVPFEKGAYLYNAKPWYSFPTVVEGETDLYKIYSYGEEVVSTLSSTISQEQYDLLSKYDGLYVAMDRDRAGYLATELIELNLGTKISLLYIPYEGNDPFDTTKESWLDAKAHATSYGEYSMHMSLALGDEYIKIQKEARKIFLKNRS